MTTLAESLGAVRKPWQWIVIGGSILVVWAAIAIPGLRRSRTNFVPVSQPSSFSGPATSFQQAERTKNMNSPAARAIVREQRVFDKDRLDAAASREGTPAGGVAVPEREIIRTNSMEMVVQHPAEVIDQITALANNLGGYLVTSDSGGPIATAGSLTVRVPASRFEEARAEIRKLGLRIVSEKVDAQDVTRQYVDQDASIRNLRAEEAGYLTILKQAATVKDMLAVSERLSEVRGQIEQQQAEFNALSKQTETVAISIALRTEAEQQVFGLNWRPMLQLELAARDGLESIATYATAMTAILFYLPAVLLWVGTILVGAFGSWRMVSWVGRRWLGWKNAL